jgi:hypothetical protein
VWPPPPPGSTPVTVRRPPPSTSPAPQAAAAAASSSSTSTPDKLVRKKAMEIALAPPAAASPDGEALASDNLAQVWKKELVHSSRGYGVLVYVTRNHVPINKLSSSYPLPFPPL